MLTSAWLGAWVVVVAAAPPAGSTWRWSVQRSASGSATAKIDGKKRSFTLEPSGLDNATLAVKVLELGDAVPGRVEVTVTSGPQSVEDRRWLVENDSGEARMLAPPGAAPTDMQKGFEQLDQLSQRAVPDLRRVLGGLFKPDPFAAATAGFPPCAPATLERVAAATGDFVRWSGFIVSSDVTFEQASARCVGKGRKYAVSTTARVLFGSGVLVLPFSGTVDVPAAGWLSTVELTAPFEFQPDGSRVALKGNGKLRLKSSMTKTK